MAHYDCRDCGASMGIAFGYCEECTTEDYKKTKKEIEKLTSELQIAYAKKIQPIIDEIERGRRSVVSEHPKIKRLTEQLREIQIRENGQ